MIQIDREIRFTIMLCMLELDFKHLCAQILHLVNEWEMRGPCNLREKQHC